MRTRRPVPVDFHRQCEDVIIIKYSLVDGSDRILEFLDMGMNELYAEREEALERVNLSTPHEFGALRTTVRLHVRICHANWLAHERGKMLGVAGLLSLRLEMTGPVFKAGWAWHCGYCSDIPGARVDIKYLRY
jgi:hypothetical protein